MNRVFRTIIIFAVFSGLIAGKTMPISAETLEDAWYTALRASHRLQAQGHQVQAARAEHQAARAARNPVVSNSTAFVALSEQPSFSFEVPSLVPGLIPAFDLDVPLADKNFAVSATTVTLPLYTGGKIKAAVDATRHQLRATHAGLAASTQDLKFEVVEAYFLVLRARQLRDVASSTERSLFRHRHDVEKMLQQKLVTKNALLAADAAWAAAQQQLLQAKNAAQIAESSYNRYLGRPLNCMVLIEEMPLPPICDDLTCLTFEAMHHRKELAQVASQSRASAALSKVAHSDRMPKVVAIAGHSYIENSHLDQNSLFSGAVAMQWTPLDGGASRARERVAMETAAAAARMRDEARSMIELEVRSAWTTEQETRSRIQVAQTGKRQADENLRVVRRQFQEGLLNHTEVLDAQVLQNAAAANLANATYDAILASYRVRRAVGLL